MKLNRIALNPLQAAWLSRNILKMLQLLESSERKNPGVRERKSYKTLNALRGKAEEAQAAVRAFGEDEQYEIDIQISPKQRAVLKDLVGSVHKNLIERAIPEYQKRGESHGEYLTNARAKAEFLEVLWRKFK